MSEKPTKQKLWGGRFTGKTDPLYVLSLQKWFGRAHELIRAFRMHQYNESLSYDKRMHAADIKGSIAYAKSLTLVGILTKEEEAKMIEGLQKVGQEWIDGTVSTYCRSVKESY